MIRRRPAEHSCASLAWRPPVSRQTPADALTQDLTALTLKHASEMVRRRRVSPVELTRACLDRIARHDSAVNAFITVDAERAAATARQMEAEQRRGRWRGPLHGIPIAHSAPEIDIRVAVCRNWHIASWIGA
jgi:hypothetical protein